MWSAGGDVLEVHNAQDLVRVFADDRDPRVPGAQEQRHRTPQAGSGVDREDVGPRHHDGADQGVPEVEDRLDQLGLVVLDHVGLGGPVHEFAEFLFAEERLAVGRRAGGDDAAKPHQPARDRAEHGVEGPDQRGAEPDQGGGVDPAELPRGHPDDHEADHRHDAGGRQTGEPDVVQHAVEEDGDGDGGGHLEPDPPEPKGAHVPHGLRQDAFERRAPAVQDRLFGVVPGQEVEGGLGSGQHCGKAKEHQRHAGKDQWGH